MNSLVTLTWKFPDFSGLVREHAEEIHMFIAAQMQTQRGLLFDSSGAHNGHTPWDPLVLRKGQPLKKSGTLSQSIGPMAFDRPITSSDGIVKITEDTITIGTKLAYARMMNDGTTKMPGGVLRPVKAKALKIPLGNGKFMFRKSVKIPARPFDTFTAEDEAELQVAFRNKIVSVMNGNSR